MSLNLEVSMYRHLFVPVDGSPISNANVGAAIKLARILCARITFFHATAEYTASSEEPVSAATTSDLSLEQSMAETNVLLLKAKASAAERGVECQTAACVSDRPAEAIVESAQRHGADLIVMASHGTRGLVGWLHTSNTERVLRQSPIALLVTRVDSNEPLRAEERALGVIEDEHRSIAVAMQSLRKLAHQELPLDGDDLRHVEMLAVYLREFPTRFHHPKEELHLHKLLRERHAGCESTLMELERQHQYEHTLVEHLLDALKPAAQASDPEQVKLRAAITALVAAIGPHMSLEERILFPIAREHLAEADWEAIATAFEAHADPGFGELPAADFHRLVRKLSKLGAGMVAGG
jgi:nucleotide-binding universal stress UspA family protein/hemerythrin-like domain-containing protein